MCVTERANVQLVQTSKQIANKIREKKATAHYCIPIRSRCAYAFLSIPIGSQIEMDDLDTF